MSLNYQHIRLHLARIREELKKGTSPKSAVEVLRSIMDRQHQADSQALHSEMCLKEIAARENADLKN